MTPAARRRRDDALRTVREIGRGLVIALSGGPDSAALAVIAAQADVAARAVHVHHHLRPAAHRDERAARELASRLGLPLRVVHVPRDMIVGREGGLEAAARRARYEAIDAARDGATVLTAHTASDRLETLLMRGAEGAGLAALAGPRPRGTVHGVPVVRPLLRWWRADVEALLREHGIVAAVDETNADVGRTRARVRHLVVPHVRSEDAEDGWDRTLAALASDAAALDAFAGAALAAATLEHDGARLVLATAPLRGLGPDACAAVLRVAAHAVEGRPHAAWLERTAQAVCAGERAVTMAHRLRAEVDADRVIVRWARDPREG